jgi:hypothetical protein
MRVLIMVAGALIAVAGIVWTLQGVGDIGGSFMSGNSLWAIIGPVTAIAGLAVAGSGLLSYRSRSRGGRA